MSTPARPDPTADAVFGAVDPLETHHAAAREEGTGLLTQILRFGATGVLAAIVDYGLLELLMAQGMGHTWAKSISFVAGTLTAYLINRRWTFRAEPSRARFLAVMALYALMFVVQVGIFTWLEDELAARGTGEFWAGTLAYVVAQGVATVTNFIVQRTVIFRMR